MKSVDEENQGSMFEVQKQDSELRRVISDKEFYAYPVKLRKTAQRVLVGFYIRCSMLKRLAKGKSENPKLKKTMMREPRKEKSGMEFYCGCYARHGRIKKKLFARGG